MEYSADNQPPGTFWSFIHRGTDSSTVAAQMTRVLPHSISVEPAAWGAMWFWKRIGRSWSQRRPSIRTVSVIGPVRLGVFRENATGTEDPAHFGLYGGPSGSVEPLPMEELGFPDRHYVQAAEGWLGLGDPAEAERELACLSPAAAGHPSALEALWRLHSARSAWSDALGTAQRHIEAAPHEAAGWIHQSYCLHELGRTSEAFQLLHSVILKFPEESVIPYNLACYACRLGELEAARRWFDQASRIGGKAMVRQMAADDPDLAPLREYIERL
jgi:hypothetical protein